MFTAQPWQASAQMVTPQAVAGEIRIESIQGTVEVNPGGNTQWRAVLSGHGLKPGDRLRTRENSRVAIRWSDQSVVRLAELSDVQIQAAAAKQRASFSLVTGILYFFNRERLTNARYGTRTASAAIRGTEFVLQADGDRTTLTVVEGEVELSNEVDAITLRGGEQGIAQPGQAPRKTPAIIVNNVIQWALYYPAVLDLDELGLTLAERNRLAASTAAYKSGDLLRALDLLPAAGPAESSPERIYRAGLLLAVGSVAEAEQILVTVGETVGAATPAPRALRLADALRQLIAAVKFQPWTMNANAELASEWLAQSYAHQSRGDLRNAIRSVQRSVEISPDFGFGWARVAELEFSFGHTGEALDALERGLQYSQRNAQALALKGFALAAQNRISEAISWFNRSITADPNLANAWLGRGLCLIRQGYAKRGREDLLTAVAMEPQRAILRSYLAKAYTDAGDEPRAANELQVAKDLDPNDPTAWLYSALLNEQENRINDAVHELEKSQELTGNRHIYRSGLLLDQDRAVRSANLARIYQDAGMSDVAIREASRAVSYDYANYSAHLFLANSFSEPINPASGNLRFEVPKRIEYLLANLLAPVGGGILSPTISEQEYSPLLEENGFGLASRTEYLSRGAWSQEAAQFGTFGASSYAVEGYYNSDPGQGPNSDLETREFLLHLKQQLTAQDTLYALISQVESEGGDVFQRYDPAIGDLDFRFKGKQEPVLVLGYHREWKPGSHTLVMGSMYKDDFTFLDPTRAVIVVSRTNGALENVPVITMNNELRLEREIYAVEAQHVLTLARHQTIAGARYLAGNSFVRNLQDNPSDLQPFFPDPPTPAADQTESLDLERFAAYVYQQLELLPSLRVFAGLTYDNLTVPRNFFEGPISREEERTEKWSPKAGAIWQPERNSVVRFAYARSLIGLDVEQALQIEPSQVAGFNRTYRTIFPQAVVGTVVGAHAETFGLSLEKKFGRSTFVSVAGEILGSDGKRTRGVFDLYPNDAFYGVPGILEERLEYTERTVSITFDQLLSDEWSVGARYGVSNAELEQKIPAIPTSFLPRQNIESTLHQLGLHVVYNHPAGFYGRGEGLWNAQSNQGYRPALMSEDFWQFNAFAGYRFYRRKVDVAVGILNLFDQDYRLSALNLHPHLPRERTFAARLKLVF